MLLYGVNWRDGATIVFEWRLIFKAGAGGEGVLSVLAASSIYIQSLSLALKRADCEVCKVEH